MKIPVKRPKIQNQISVGDTSRPKPNNNKEIKETFTRHDYLLDPHTATGVRASNGIVNKEEPVITMGTAHPAKFTEAIEKALPSYTSELPNKVAKAFEQDEIFTILPDDYLEIKQFILSKAL